MTASLPLVDGMAIAGEAPGHGVEPECAALASHRKG
jgi:hypothetical protein